MVFDRSSRHGQTMIGLQQAAGLRRLGMVILDGLGLVQDRIIETDCFQFQNIAAQGPVRRDQHITSANFLQQFVFDPFPV